MFDFVDEWKERYGTVFLALRFNLLLSMCNIGFEVVLSVFLHNFKWF